MLAPSESFGRSSLEGREANLTGSVLTTAAKVTLRDSAIMPSFTQRNGWGLWRQRAAHVIQHVHFDSAIGVVIMFNVLFMVLDTNANAECEAASCSHRGVIGMGYACLAVYTCELMIRGFVFRLNALRSPWVLLDLVVVLSGYLEIILQPLVSGSFRSGTDILKLLRVARLCRATKLLGHFPALRAIINGFLSAMMAMLWGGLAIVGLLFTFSILAVELVHTENLAIDHDDLFCMDAFSSVQMSLLFFIQTAVIGDQWGCVIPLVLEHWYLSFLFIGVYALVQLGLMNLILTAVVEEAEKAKEREMEEQLACNKAKQDEQIELLRPVFEEIAISSGSLTAEDIVNAYDDDPRLQHALSLFHVSRNDLTSLAGLMDFNGDGVISYEEFTQTVQASQTQDVRILMMTLKLQLSQLLHGLSSCMNGLSTHVASVAQGVDKISSTVNGGAPRAGGVRPSDCAEKHKRAWSAASVDIADHGVASVGPELRALTHQAYRQGASKPHLAGGSRGEGGGAAASPEGVPPIDGLTALEAELRAFQRGVHLQVELLLKRQLDLCKPTRCGDPATGTLPSFTNDCAPVADVAHSARGADGTLAKLLGKQAHSASASPNEQCSVPEGRIASSSEARAGAASARCRLSL